MVRVRQQRKKTTTQTKAKTKKSVPKIPLKPTRKSPRRRSTTREITPEIYESDKEEEQVVSATIFSPKRDVFDDLLEESQKSTHIDKSKITKTYENRRRNQQLDEHEDVLLEFHDCKNREDILKWLNDNRNIFEHYSQLSQAAANHDDPEDIPLSLADDMPSISQIKSINSRVTRSQINNSSKVRAKSLEIKVSKNVKRGRVKRHSLASDNPLIENYNIEDDEEPVEPETKVLLNMVEDEYLSTLDKELRAIPKGNGWETIKDLERTLNKIKKKPKPLDITIRKRNSGSKKSSPEKSDTNSTEKIEENLVVSKPNFDQNITEKSNVVEEIEYKTFTVNFDAIEDFTNKNIENPQIPHDNNKNCCIFHKNLTAISREIINETKNSINLNHPTNVTIIEEHGKNFIKSLENYENLDEFLPLYSEIQKIFHKFSKTIELQTDLLPKNDINIQTDIVPYIDIDTQTESKIVDNIAIQTSIDVFEQETQTSIIQSVLFEEKNIQTSPQNYKNEEIQTSHSDNNKNEFVQTSLPTNNHQEIQTSQQLKQIETTPVAQVDLISPDIIDDDGQPDDMVAAHDSMNFDFETEDLMKEASLKSEIVISLSACSSKSKKDENVLKGVKRSRSPDVEEHKTLKKRPCEKFIPDQDVSVEIDSQDEEPVVDQNNGGGGESKEVNCDKYVDKLLEENSKKSQPIDHAMIQSKTQEIIEQCDMLIYNATKQKIKAKSNIENKENIETVPDKQIDDMNQINQIDSDDYFNTEILNEQNLNKIEQDISIYESKNVEKLQLTPQSTSRKNLFGKNDENAVSDPMFVDNDKTLVPLQESFDHENNVTLTENVTAVNNLPVTPNQDEKVRILQNILLREAYSDDDNDVVIELDDNDDDIIDTTPQKKVKSFVREADFLNVTLPPPLEFQDVCRDIINKTPTIQVNDKVAPSTPSQHDHKSVSNFKLKNIRHSTPNSQKHSSNSLLSLSPISLEQNNFLKSIQTPKRNSADLPRTSIQNNNTQESKDSQLTDISTPKSQQKPCIACSRVSKDQIISISALTNKKLATYSTTLTPKVTHLIVSVDGSNRIKDHTMKYITAVASGIWVLSFKWIQDCLAQNMIVPEEPYEVIDVSGVDGPRQSRLKKSSNPLLKGFKICGVPPFISTTQSDLEHVVKLLGARTVPKPENLVMTNDGMFPLIITEARATQDFDLYEMWVENLKVISVDIEWLSRSIGRYKLMNLRPFALCSDDIFSQLSYPHGLLDPLPDSEQSY